MSTNGVETFKEQYPSLESYWRAVILFGRNTASYKFALAKSILEMCQAGKSTISLEELAVPFAQHLCRHMAQAPKQGTTPTNSLLKACKGFNEGQVSAEQLHNVTVSQGFNYVLDAFHKVNGEDIPVSFFQKVFTPQEKKIILTDEFFKLLDTPFRDNFSAETEARWNLVETAWELGVSRNLLNVHYDDHSKLFFVNSSLRRKDVTSARDALNGYQKGKCFYCFDDISVTGQESQLCDVDHFFPHTLQAQFKHVNLDGVWNLVLTCPNCNRGTDGKFARVPAVKYLERLRRRNEFLIASHHPLRETIIQQTGNSTEARQHFLAETDKIAINTLIHRWETPLKGDEIF